MIINNNNIFSLIFTKWAYGKQSWYQNGELHNSVKYRDNDKPAIIRNGTQIWYKNGIWYK